LTWALATIAALLIGYAAVSRRLERLNVSGAVFFTTAGPLVGPVLGLLDLQVGGEQVKLLAEITLTLVLFADASRISLRALHREYSVPLRLLGIGLPLTIVAAALVGAAVIPGGELRGGTRARDRARMHRRRARPGGGLGRAHPVADPPRSERRERAQRWALRAAVLHRDRYR
jgi:sodium/hydrogen exchanger family protein